ncbi:hypothetical protein, partial [Cupriavidus sp. AcVe19-6a]|uniref:hypothetical protein n=1 Tax=Cupriavidus sp. AcVe19-6a TaxID=2821358 RepID=UPI001AE7F548
MNPVRQQITSRHGIARQRLMKRGCCLIPALRCAVSGRTGGAGGQPNVFYLKRDRSDPSYEGLRDTGQTQVWTVRGGTCYLR